MIEARSLHVVVSSDHVLADERVVQAVARVLSRYAIAFTPAVEIIVPQDGIKVTYTAKAATTLASPLRRARTLKRVPSG